MSNQVFKVVLLQALPASGKSEVRNFMAHVEPERLRDEFHIGENLQLEILADMKFVPQTLGLNVRHEIAHLGLAGGGQRLQQDDLKDLIAHSVLLRIVLRVRQSCAAASQALF